MADRENEATNAVRYAVLRRLTPGFRHGLVGELQAIGSLAELTARQLREAADLAQAQDGMAHIITHSRKAVGSCNAIIDWLVPKPGATSVLGESIAQCLKAAGDAWPLRGIGATVDLQDANALVDTAALRELFTAAVIAMIDMNPGALDIDVQSVVEGEHVDITLRARAAERRSSLSPLDHERPFTWADVQVLANAHGVPCTCHAHGATLRLRRIAHAPA